MLLGKIEKQPTDRQNYFVKYEEYLQEGELLLSALAQVDIVGELYVIGPVVMADDKTLEFWLEDGVDGVTYKLDITVTTTIGNVKQDEFKVKVKEV